MAADADQSTKPRDPWGLVKIAMARETTPRALLREMLSTSATYTEAAGKLGVSRKALWRYCKVYNMTMQRAAAEEVTGCPNCEGHGVIFGLWDNPYRPGPKFYGLMACKVCSGANGG